MESTERAGDGDQDTPLVDGKDDKAQSRFRTPFKVYENFRNVYKGVRKTRTSSSSAQYDVSQTSEGDRIMTSSSDLFAGGSSSSSTDESSNSDLGIGMGEAGCIVVSVNQLNSLDTSLSHCGSPSPRSDGNTTDDSGIDSICDRTANEGRQASPEADLKSAIAAFALGDDFINSNEVKSSPGAKAKSVLHDTYGSLKRHTMMDHPWKRDFVLLQASSASGSGKLKKMGSKEDLLLSKSGKKSSNCDSVELTSVRSKVKETVQALENRYAAPSSPNIPIYSTINRATKKNKRNLVEEVLLKQNENTAQPANKPVSLASLRFPVEEEVADIAEITQLLSNTNELLNRSSHLRASLTVSVRHPGNKKSAQTTTFLFPGKKKELNGSKKSKAKKSGLWNNLLHTNKKPRDESDVDDENSSSSADDVKEVEKVSTDKGISRYEEANARIAAKFEKERNEGPNETKTVEEKSSEGEENNTEEEDEEEMFERRMAEESAATPFARHNPARRALGPGAAVDIRRSVRLAPKTVANLASKFDSLLVNSEPSKTSSKVVEKIEKSATVTHASDDKKTVLPEKEMKLCKKDISKIIDALNKLEDDAKKSLVIPASKAAGATAKQPRATVVTSTRFSAIGRKSLRQKHGMSLAVKSSGTKNGELSKKNSVRRVPPPDQQQLVEVEKIDKKEELPSTTTTTTVATTATTTEKEPKMMKEVIETRKPVQKLISMQQPMPVKRPFVTSTPKFSSRDEITNKMQSAKSLLSSVELPSDTNQSVSLTDRYLKKLATLAESTNNSSFRTSAPPTKSEQNFRQTRWTPILPIPAAPKLTIRNKISKDIYGPGKSSTSGEGSIYQYDDVGARSLRYLDLEHGKGLNHSYMDLAGSSHYGSRGSMLSAYDDVKPPSVHTYLSLSNRSSSTDTVNTLVMTRRSVSEDNLSLLRYDPVETSSLVTARPAIVREDQLDSLSYIYDDVGSASLYNSHDGPGLYESIAGSILNLARNKMGFDAASVENLYASLTKNTGAGASNNSSVTDTGAGASDGDGESISIPGPHEVLTYTLAKWSAAHWSETRPLSSARSSNRSSERKSVISDKSDEWIDLEDDDEYENSATPQAHNFARSSFRVSNRKKWANSSNRLRRRQWNQAVLEASKPMETGHNNNNSNNSNSNDSDTYYEGSSTRSKHDGGGVSIGDDDLYESIYEVIRAPSESDFEEIPMENEESKHKSMATDGPSNAPGSGLTKLLTEGARKKMKKLRRNWSLKKNDISRSLSRIRKYSSGNPPLPQSNNIVTIGNSIPIRDTTTTSTTGLRKKPSRRTPSFWMPDAKSVVRQHGGPVVGDGSPGDTTFYITLTIEQDEEDDEEDEDVGDGGTDGSKFYEGGSSSAIETDSRSQTISMSSSSMQSGSSKTPDTSWTSTTLSETSSNARSSGGGAIPPPRRKTNKQIYSVVRPTEAPPAPPPPPPLPKGLSPPAPKPQNLTFNFGSQQQPDSLLLCDSIAEYPQPPATTLVNPFMGSPCSEDSGSDLITTLLMRDQLEETYTSSLFQTEPLYQFYDKDLNESHPNSRLSSGSSCSPCSSSSSGRSPQTENMYECIDQDASQDKNQYSINNNRETFPSSNPAASKMTSVPDEKRPEPPPTRRRKKMTSRPSAMDLIQASSSPGGRRSMWTELPEVVDSGIIATISNDRKKLQEAMFEVITSEASYLKSLNILIWHFAQSAKLIGDPPYVGGQGVIGKRDHRILFSDVIAVRQCSEKFLEDLEKRWQSSVLLNGLCEVVRQHAENNFQVYVKYCSNQVYQDRILKKLRSENPKFVEVLRELESSPVCQSLAMHSFLMLPMQRITRLPLLLDAIFNRLNTDSQEYIPCKEALQTLNKLVKECNESARNMERMEEMLILSQQLDFREVKAVPLISASRWLVKRGDVVRIWWKDNAEAKLTFGRRVNRQNHCFFLFTDLLVIGKKKSDESYLVVDYCPRNLVQMSELENSEGILPGGKTLPDVHNYLAWLTLLQNNEGKTIEWLVAFNSECERRRWTEAVTPQTSENPEEKIYEEWDCPLVEAIKPFHARESDELALEQGEKANVLRKLSDSGWYYVERRSDGGKGWVPMSVTREIESNHVRARNYKQRYAFLKLLSSEDPVATSMPPTSS